MVKKRTATCMFVATLGLAVFLACGAEEITVPSDLMGLWVSDRAGYEDSGMEFRESSVIFSSAGGEYTVNPIQALDARREEESSRTRFELVYSNGGKSVETTLYVSDDGVLVFENQRAVAWKKAASEGSGDP